jgi:hypothetical protein
MAELRAVIETFLSAAKQPVVIEPGEDPIALGPENFLLSGTASRLAIEFWSSAKNLKRRVIGVRLERRGKLELDTELFGGRKGRLLLVDLANPVQATATRRGDRLKFREQFRMALNRQYPDWRIAELSTDPDLEHSLSPTYPRALLRKGTSGMAAIAAAEDSNDPDGALSFGLIWLDYLRRREPRLSIGGLLVFLPIGAEVNTCHRVRHLDPATAQVAVFVHGPKGVEEPVHPEDYTNFATRVEPLRPPAHSVEVDSWLAHLALLDGVQQVMRPNGTVSLNVRGIEFARSSGSALLFGVDQKHAGGLAEAEGLACGLARMRRHDAEDRRNPLYLRHPEAWLESSIRANVQSIDGPLLAQPIYSQAPHIASADRGILDLLAVDFEGRLTVIEIKAVEDIHLPLQALDYWMRVKWHLERGDFTKAGYFPGITLRPDAPRLLLVAPSLEFHPTNEALLRCFSSDVTVERIGVGLEWRRELKVVLRQTCR